MVHVPVVRRKPWGILCMVMNLIPGVGTMMAGANQENTRYFVYGLLQFLLAWTVIAYVWGLVMGVMIFVKSE